MASLRKLSRSPFWYLRYRCPETGRWLDRCLKLRLDDPADCRRALAIERKASSDEAVAGPSDRSAEFDSWVPGYIERHYSNARSRQRYQHAWGHLRGFLRGRKIRHPAQVRYEHVGAYMDWRRAGGGSHNTARLEVKFLAFVLREGIRRGFCDRNPVEMARIERTPVKQKPDLTDSDILATRKAFLNQASWMGVVFEILIHLGCRFAESSIPWGRIDFDARTIILEDSKRGAGDPRRLFLVPMSDQLAGILQPLRNKGTERTVPVLTGEMNHRFNAVMKKACGATSHSCRVSFISRCHRAGLSESEAMRLVNHSTRLVHAVYTRLSVADARAALDRIQLPPAP